MYIRKSFLGFVRIYIADQGALFKGLLPPPEVGGELAFDDEMPPRSSSLPPRSAWWLTADSFLWVTGNTLPGTDQVKKVHFWGTRSRRRPTKCALWHRRAHQIWSLIANFFTRPCFSCRMLKIVSTEPDGHVQELSQWPGILLNALTATVATISWIVSIFSKIAGGPHQQCFCWP